MEWIGWGFLVLTAVLVVFLIRVLNQVSRTVHGLDSLLNNLEKEIIPLVKNLKETSENVNQLLGQAQERLHQIDNLFLTLKESAQIFSLINRIMRGGVASSLINLASLGVGIKTASNTFLKRKPKGGK